ncbi:MAG: gamma-glutamyltranspeptidase/glutathione hydrolase [Candidatus Azotimanducaceae bacterium]|jgi:gamma-glutamyltranspeptidase/glutathione hydrolase
MIVSAQPEASEAGAQVLRSGGNAIDAAMTAALVQGVVDPQMTGIAGFGNCQIFMPGRGVHTCIDFHGKTPNAATADMWQDRLIAETRDGFGFVLEDNINDVGYQAITTPGSLKAYSEAVGEFGTYDWGDICQPAIEYAQQGFIIRPAVYNWWMSGASLGRADVTSRLKHTPASQRLYFDANDELRKVGDRLQNPDLARTLERIATQGADCFYTGDIAEEIAADMAANGGLLSLGDLAQYQTTRNDPLRSEYRGFEVATNHPPGGGIMLVEMLNILAHFDLQDLGHNSSEYIRIVCEAMKAATQDKETFVGDPAFIEVPVERLTGAALAQEYADRIRRGEKIEVQRFTTPESRDTTHVAVVDAQGNCVTMTHSLGMPSGVVTEGLGFMYNGCMGVFDPRPGRTGSIAPGKSRFSSLCPTIVFDNDVPRIVIGAPGGTQIAMGVLQALLNLLDFQMPIVEAVSAPRFSATSNMIDISNRIAEYDVQPLRQKGYEVARSANTFDFGRVHGITNLGGILAGGADPGSDGVAFGLRIPNRVSPTK